MAVGLTCNLAQNHYYKADNTETYTPSYTLVNLSVGTDLNIRHKKVAEIYITADNNVYSFRERKMYKKSAVNLTGNQIAEGDNLSAYLI